MTLKWSTQFKDYEEKNSFDCHDNPDAVIAPEIQQSLFSPPHFLLSVACL